jgi:hypothetical protein
MNKTLGHAVNISGWLLPSGCANATVEKGPSPSQPIKGMDSERFKPTKVKDINSKAMWFEA